MNITEYINNFKEVPSNLIHVFSDCLTLNNDNNIEIIIKNAFKDKELNIDMNNYLQLNEIIGNCLTNAIEAVPDNGGFLYVYFYQYHDFEWHINDKLLLHLYHIKYEEVHILHFHHLY